MKNDRIRPVTVETRRRRQKRLGNDLAVRPMPVLVAMAWLLPAGGCTTPPRMPWQSSQPPVPAVEPDTVASSQPSVFRMAAHRVRSQIESDAELADTATITELPTGQPQPAPVPVDPVALGADEFAPPATVEAAPQLIDLASALGMAGGNAWIIQLARQRTVEAHADLRQAKALWLPTLQLGLGWNNHGGRIQVTNGEVIEASRSSFYYGGGATLGSAPLAGGSGGPIRLFADLALADAFFEPKIAGRQLSARRAGVSVAKNQALLDAALAYVDLLEAAGQLADTQAAIAAADELLGLTRTFAEAGAGAQADVDRAATERAALRQQLDNAHRLYRTRSATLARRLRLDPQLILHPADQLLVPIELAGDTGDVASLVRSALSQRPEINSLAHEIKGLCTAARKAQVEPWLPHLAVTTSGGSFAGGNGSNLDNRGSRSDVDLLAVWQLESLGVGVAARRGRADSRLAQRRIELSDLRDQIQADVVAACEDVANYRAQIETANTALQLAELSYERNLQRVRADEGLPIELLQAITARAGGGTGRPRSPITTEPNCGSCTPPVNCVSNA